MGLFAKKSLFVVPSSMATFFWRTPKRVGAGGFYWREAGEVAQKNEGDEQRLIKKYFALYLLV